MIVISTPTRDSITAKTMADTIRVIKRDPANITFIAPLGIYIGMLREQSVNLARQIGASHLLFIDADMRFPPETLETLLAHDEDIVCANYVQRTMPSWWVSRTDQGPLSSLGRTGLQQVKTTGAGCLLIRLSIFDDLPKPWFATPYENGVHLGEDVYFCEHVRAHGFEVWVDHDLSQLVRHQNSVELGVDAGLETTDAVA